MCSKILEHLSARCAIFANSTGQRKNAINKMGIIGYWPCDRAVTHATTGSRSTRTGRSNRSLIARTGVARGLILRLGEFHPLARSHGGPCINVLLGICADRRGRNGNDDPASGSWPPAEALRVGSLQPGGWPWIPTASIDTGEMTIIRQLALNAGKISWENTRAAGRHQPL